MRVGWSVVVVVLVSFVAGCLGASTTTCGDGRVCPSGTTCVSFGCATPAQLAACSGKADAAECTLSGDKTGECHEGVCLSIGCGNRLLEVGEACDDGNTVGGDGCSARCDSDETCGNAFLDTAKSEGCDCGSADFTGTRPPGCNGKPNSDDADTVCTSTCSIRGCGDGSIGGLEDCDGSALGGKTCGDVGYYGGTLGCKASCKFDVSACTGRCGDGTRNGTPTELCDGADLGASTCTTFGYYNAGGLTCNALCGFDTSACTGFCGDNTFQSTDEVCDSMETEADLNARGLDCLDFGFYLPGGLACGSNCQIDTSSCGGGFCGDGTKDAGEDCDGTDVDNLTCTQFGYYGTGTLACRDNCTFDFAGCATQGRCGDTTVNGPEECDGPVAAGTDCTDFGYYTAGSVSCRANCTFDFAGCANAGKCGDGVVNGGEQCDGSLGTKTCLDYNYYAQDGLQCSAACTYDISGCRQKCGDGIINGTEQCDGGQLGVADCKTLGYYNANGLKCSSTCNFDDSSCTGFCGDKIVNGTEDCDGGPPASSCLDLGYDGGRTACNHFCIPDVDACDRFGWWPAPPPAPGLSMTAISGTARNDIWTVATQRLYHYNGSIWTASPAAPTSTLQDLWIASASDVWVTGAGGSVARYNGTAWTPTNPGTAWTYNGIWGTSATNVFVVGGDGTTGVISRFTGTWTSTTVGASQLTDVWGTSATNAIAVGMNGVAYHWDGSSWATMNTTVPHSLLAVWGSSPTDVWAVGNQGTILHYDGNVSNNWTAYPMTTFPFLKGVYGVGPNNIFAVGNNSFMHWDGTRWETMQTRVISALGVWAADGDDVWAVGGSTTAHFGGHTLSSLTCTGYTNDFNAVWSNTANDAFFAGNNNAMYRYDGVSCSAMASSGMVQVNGIWGASASDVWAVGSGGIRHYDGTGSWASMPSGTVAALSSVSGADANNVFAAAINGDVVRWNGTAWTLSRDRTIAGTAQFLGIWASSPSKVFAVGNSTPISQFDGTSWTQIGSTFFARAITGSGSSYAVTNNMRYDGTTWHPSAAPPFGTAYGANALWAQSPRSVYAVGDGGAMYHYDGLGWTAIRTNTVKPLGGVSGAGNSVHIVGGTGTALELEQYCGSTETRCSNQWDDDCDGLLNCADPDCSANPFCTSGGACSGWTAVSCGANVASSNAGGGVLIDGYGCGTSEETYGAEVVYRFVALANESVTVSLAKNAFLDLAVLSAGASGACDPHGGCIDAAFNNSSGATLTATFNATAGATYYIVVDGKATSTVAPFTLQVTCN